MLTLIIFVLLERLLAILTLDQKEFGLAKGTGIEIFFSIFCSVFMHSFLRISTERVLFYVSNSKYYEELFAFRMKTP